jgi:hypothetical protein
MIRLTHVKDPLTHMLTFDSREGRRRQVSVETEDDWKSEAFVKSAATLVTGTDHTKLRESIEVVDRDGRRLYYIEKL